MSVINFFKTVNGQWFYIGYEKYCPILILEVGKGVRNCITGTGNTKQISNEDVMTSLIPAIKNKLLDDHTKLIIKTYLILHGY